MAVMDLIRVAVSSFMGRARAMLTGAVTGRLDRFGPEPAWCHIQLMASNGARIDVDYQIKRDGDRVGSYKADPVWINVKHPLLGPNSEVKVVFLEVDRRSGGSELKEIELEYQGDSRFSGSAALQTSFIDRHELAVVADGRWLRDPVNGTHNFQFDLGQGLARCLDTE